MARIAKRGLEYLPLDVDFFADIKIGKLRRKCDEHAPMIYIALLCEIYKEGYYMKWDEDFAFVLADKTRTDEDYVNGVLLACLDVGLLDADMFAQHRILTSRGIQRQYSLIGEKSRRKSGINEYSLLDDEPDEEINAQESPINAQEYPINAQESGLMQQECNKEKKSKEKKSKENFFIAASSEEEAEEEKIIYYFSFERNWEAPNAEYRKMVAYNSSPNVRKKWRNMTSLERWAIATMWKQTPETKRFGEAFRFTWRRIYDKAADFAPKNIRTDILDDKVTFEGHQSDFVLHVTADLKEFLEENLDVFKPILWPYMQKLGYNRLVYKIYKPLKTEYNGKS